MFTNARMGRGLALVGCLALGLVLTGCGGSSTPEATAAKNTGDSASPVETAAAETSIAPADPASVEAGEQANADRISRAEQVRADREARAAKAREAREERARLARDGTASKPATDAKADLSGRAAGDADNPRRPQRPATNLPAADDFVGFEPSTLDYGTIPVSVPVDGAITLVNRSAEPLTITNAKASCGCTTPDWPRDPIAPGDSVEIKIGLKTPAKPGPLKGKRVTFSFDKCAPVIVPLKADLFAYVTISPDPIPAPTEANPGQANDAEIVLTSTDGTPFKITSVTPPFILDLSEEEKTEHRVNLSWGAWDEAGGGYKKMTFALTHPKAKSVSTVIKAPFRGRNTNLGNTKGDTANRPNPRDTAPSSIITAARTGNVETLQKAIDGGANLDLADRTGRSPLLWAAVSDQPEAIAVLVDAGADINATDRAGRGALALAAEKGNADAIRALIDAGADITATDRAGGTPLTWASGLGSYAAVEALLEAGADPKIVDINGMSPLMWASGFGESASVKALIDAGADINASDKTQQTALMVAARNGKHLETVHYLLEAKADLEAQNIAGQTALILAAGNSNAAKVKALIEAGADLDAKDLRGWTALDHAKNRPDGEAAAVVEVLEAADGDE